MFQLSYFRFGRKWLLSPRGEPQPNIYQDFQFAAQTKKNMCSNVKNVFYININREYTAVSTPKQKQKWLATTVYHRACSMQTKIDEKQ